MKQLKIGDKGNDVRELQIALCGFDGGVFDGIFGMGTEASVKKFQGEFMGVRPTGKVDKHTIESIIDFGKKHPLNWNKLRCNCGVCDGFGRGLFKFKYREYKPKIEAYYNYEYPGIHRAVLWLAKAIKFYCSGSHVINVNSGYRCSENNKQNNRTSTNHHGKAIDLVVVNTTPDKVCDDTNHAKKITAINSNIQVGWEKNNMKSLEPEKWSKSWLHVDVRSFNKKYLYDKFFVKDEKSIYDELLGYWDVKND